jgi:hypothetical protein
VRSATSRLSRTTSGPERGIPPVSLMSRCCVSLTDAQIGRLTDVIGESSNCNDNECSCHKVANLAKDILDGRENYEVIDGN